MATANFLADKLETVIYEDGVFHWCVSEPDVSFLTWGKIKNLCGIKQENNRETQPNHEDFTVNDTFH
jgi:hypothetical protein